MDTHPPHSTGDFTNLILEPGDCLRMRNRARGSVHLCDFIPQKFYFPGTRALALFRIHFQLELIRDVACYRVKHTFARFLTAYENDYAIRISNKTETASFEFVAVPLRSTAARNTAQPVPSALSSSSRTMFDSSGKSGPP